MSADVFDCTYLCSRNRFAAGTNNDAVYNGHGVYPEVKVLRVAFQDLEVLRGRVVNNLTSVVNTNLVAPRKNAETICAVFARSSPSVIAHSFRGRQNKYVGDAFTCCFVGNFTGHKAAVYQGNGDTL